VGFENVGGQAGYVTVKFSGNAVADIPGNDLLIHLLDWIPSDNETFQVFASADGLAYSSIGFSGPPTGGVNAPIVLGFDLTTAGFSSAKFFRVVNSRITSACCEGPDIDAFAAVSTVVPEVASTGMLLGVGLCALASLRKKF